jgi:hypothetical protein
MAASAIASLPFIKTLAMFATFKKFSGLVGQLFFYSQYKIGAHFRTARTTDAQRHICDLRGIVTFSVNCRLGQHDDFFGACCHAKPATLAGVLIDCYLCHNRFLSCLKNAK